MSLPLIPRWSAGTVILAGLFLTAAPSAAGEHDHGAGAGSADTSQLDPATAEIARRLWGDLVCLCGRCQRLTLSACHCPDAAAERKKVLELLRGRDLSTHESAEATYQGVVKEYAARFSGRHVLASEQRSGPPEDWPALVVSVAVIAVAVVAVVFLESRRRGRKRQGSRRRS